jgi:hypothetical protein
MTATVPDVPDAPDATGPTVAVAAPDAATRRRGSRIGRWGWPAVGVLSVVLVAVLHLWVAWPAHGPVWTDDEIGILANARLIAGLPTTYDLAHLSYYPGWSLVLAPLWWVLDDPLAVYRAGVFLSALCAVLLVWPLAALVRRVGIGWWPALVVASAVAVAPGRTGYSSYLLTENAVTLMVAVSAVAAARYAERRTPLRAALLGLSAAYTFVVHGRMVALLGMTVVWLLVELVRRRWSAAAGLVTAVGGAAAGFALHLWVSAQLYGSAGAREENAVGALLGQDPMTALRAASGQSWYLLAAWISLPVLGTWLLLRLCRSEVARRDWGLGWWGLGIVVGTAIISAGGATTSGLVRGSPRLDYHVYGRYLEPVVVVLAALGLAMVLRGFRRRTGWTTVVVALVVGGVFLLWAMPQIPRGGWWGMINIAGLLGRSWPMQDDPGTPPWAVFTATFLLAAVVWLLVRGRRVLAPIALAGVLAYFAVSAVVAQDRLIRSENQALGVAPDLVHVIEDVDPDAIAYDSDGADWVGQNTFQWWLTGREVQVFDSSTQEAPTDVVIARSAWPAGERDGARRVAGSQRDEALWVLPGVTQDAYAAAGLLEPPPGEAIVDQDARIAVAPEEQTPVVAAAGEELTFEVTNEGSDVWPALGTLDGPEGSVRLVLWWRTPDGADVPELAELPHSLVPGATLEVPVEIEPPADVDVGVPLRVTLVQEGWPPFTVGSGLLDVPLVAPAG